MTQEPVDRIAAFATSFDERCAELIEPTAFGTAYLHGSFPRRWDSNFVRIDTVGADVEADAVAADSDRVLGEHGLAHRKVTVDDDRAGHRLAPGFLGLGWSSERLLAMAQVRDPEPRPPAEVEELDLAAARPMLDEVLREQPEVEEDETRRQLVDARALFEREVGARFYVAHVDGEPAAVCETYTIGDVTMVEDVNTLARFRGRGLASAVVLRAAEVARGRGSDLVFLVADDADWPKELYARLGFDPVLRTWAFARATST